MLVALSGVLLRVYPHTCDARAKDRGPLMPRWVSTFRFLLPLESGRRFPGFAPVFPLELSGQRQATVARLSQSRNEWPDFLDSFDTLANSSATAQLHCCHHPLHQAQLFAQRSELCTLFVG